jgi:hypothetical protein
MRPAAPTRRELVRGGVLAGVSASTLARSTAAVAASAPAPSDAEVLARILAVEQLVVVGYRWAIASGVLSAEVGREVGELLGHELQHIAILERELRARHAAAPAQPAGTAAAQLALRRHHIRASPSRLRTQHQCLKLLIDLESLAEGAYFSAISKLHDPALLRTSAEIMGSEAQHWTVLSAAQHHGDVGKSVPYPFVQGSS